MQMQDESTVHEWAGNGGLQLFPEPVWISLVERVGRAFSMKRAARRRMERNRVLKLVAAIPYLAGCEEPDRIAVSHMGTCILASEDQTKGIFSHRFRDDVVIGHRLERISHFPDGDALIIRRGMDLLAMAMISDHVHDAANDRKMGKMNPVDRKTWDPEALLKSLGDSVYSVDCPEMDAIMDPDTIPGFWAV